MELFHLLLVQFLHQLVKSVLWELTLNYLEQNQVLSVICALLDIIQFLKVLQMLQLANNVLQDHIVQRVHPLVHLAQLEVIQQLWEQIQVQLV
jgi:nicotinic acid phosphoribosyltransferase